MIEVRIPKAGMSTVEVEVVGVLVEVGQRVSAGDELIEVEGDKATFAVEAEADGVVAEILVRVGDEREVGDVVARLDAEAAG